MLPRERGHTRGEVVLTQRPVGYAAIDGVCSLRDPSLILFGVDSAGSKAPGWLRLDPKGQVRIDPATQALVPPGLMVGAQWIDQEQGLEWCLAGAPDGWRLLQIDARHPARTRTWPLVLERDQDGELGSGYFCSTIDGDELFLACAHSRFGLLGVSASELVHAALASPPEQALTVAWKWRTQIHTGGDATRMYAWKPSVHRFLDGRRWLAVPCGFDGDPNSPTENRARVVLFALGREQTGAPVPMGVYHELAPGGHAKACAWFEHQGAPVLAVLDLIAGLRLIDPGSASGPVLIGALDAPREAFDGAASNFLDLALEIRSNGSVLAFVAAGRLGLVGIDLCNPRRMDLKPEFVLDTPGWAAGLHLDTWNGKRRLLLGDQKAGLIWLR